MIRVEVPDAENAKALVQALACAFEPTAVSLEADRGEVRLQERHDSSQTIVQMLGTIHAWLGAATIESVTVWLDDNRYTLAWQPAPAAGGQ